MTDALRVIYAGTPEFAVPALQSLIESHHEVVVVLDTASLNFTVEGNLWILILFIGLQ